MAFPLWGQYGLIGKEFRDPRNGRPEIPISPGPHRGMEGTERLGQPNVGYAVIAPIGPFMILP